MRCEDFPCCGHPPAEGCEDRAEFTAEFYYEHPELLYEPGSPEWHEAVERDEPDCDDLECPHGCENVVVEEDGVNAGFTGAPIYWANLSCGHQWVDLSQDTIDRVR